MSDKQQTISLVDFGKLMVRVDAIAEQTKCLSEHTKCLLSIKTELGHLKGRVDRNEESLRNLHDESGVEDSTMAVKVERNEKDIEKINARGFKIIIAILGTFITSFLTGILAHFK